MKVEIVGDPGPEWTDNPRKLDMSEAYEVVHLTRLEGIKRHRQLTRSTLAAAMREVDDLRRIAGR